MLDDYLNQSLEWKHVTSINEYNEPTYTTATIKGRKETGHKLIRNVQGQEVVSSAWFSTESAVCNNDLIDGSLVISIEFSVDLDGVTQWREGYLT